MTRGRTVTECIHLLALGIWLGGLGVAGASAGQFFVIMRGLDPALPAYAGYRGAHWSIAAGHMVQPLFLVVDIVQFACVLIAGATFVVAAMAMGLSLRRVSTFARALLILSLLTVLSYRFFVIAPGAMQSLAAYWQAAAAGQTDAALIHKGIFDAAHAVDRRLTMATLLLVVCAIATALWSIVDRRSIAPARQVESELEVPMLARR